MNGGSYPGMPFNQQFTVPRELTLRTTSKGVRLCMNPVVELESLRSDAISLKQLQSDGVEEFIPFDGASRDYNLLDYEISIQPKDAPIVVEARGRRIELDPVAKTATYEGVVAPLEVVDGAIQLRLVLDVTSLEIFVGDGSSQIAKCFVPEDENDAPILRVQNAKAVGVRCWTMKSVWK
jgi:sucrose-6-phosphate hydrolase SacC (GH32 family)